MKIKHLAIGLLATTLLYSCGGEAPVVETPVEEVTAEATSMKVDAENSTVAWAGGIVGGGYGHTGTLKISEGTLQVAEGVISGGSFTIDMKSMAATDQSYSAEKTPEMLIGHLSNGDFFLVDSFPTAQFVITAVEGAKVTGDLTIRGTTKQQVVDVTSSEVTEAGATVAGKFVFNRQDFGVSYASTMKDMVISDDITVEVSLTTKK